ncbi:hypothetical protein BHM03_00016018 [Ensete ventricosum]|nr:hypothetical protein BHM03_00016018 [Ensete ventricosum]
MGEGGRRGLGWHREFYSEGGHKRRQGGGRRRCGRIGGNFPTCAMSEQDQQRGDRRVGLKKERRRKSVTIGGNTQISSGAPPISCTTNVVAGLPYIVQPDGRKAVYVEIVKFI